MDGFTRKKLATALTTIPMIIFAAGCGDEDSPLDPGGDGSLSLPDAQSLSIQLTGLNDAYVPEPRGGDGSRDVVVVDHTVPGANAKWLDGKSAAADSASSSNYNAGRTAFSTMNSSVAGLASASAYAFAGAFATTPSAQPDGSWLWSYSMLDGWLKYDLALTGRVNNGQTEWTMYVTTTGRTRNASSFLWMTGTTAANGLSGSWQIYDMDAPSASTTLLRIDWTRDASGGITSFWLNNRVGHPGYGDYLTYSLSQNEATLEYSKSGGSYSSDLRWNLTTTAGSVRMPLYNSGSEACWDEQHINMSCSQ